MDTTEILKLSALELGKAIKDKKTTSVEAVTAYLEAIDRLDGKFNSYITVRKEEALKDAALIDEKITSGELTGDFAGVPVAVKDNMCTDGLLTTCG